MTSSSATTIDAVAFDFACNCFAAERRLIGAAWFHPTTYYNLALEHQLSGSRFADCDMGLIHAYLCSCTDHGVEPTLRGCIDVVRQVFGVTICATEIYSLVLDDDVQHDRIGEHAAEVARLFDVRENTGRRHLQAVAELMVNADDFDVIVRRRQPATRKTQIPKHLRRRKSTCAA